MTAPVGTKAHKLFSFTAIYILNIYSDDSLSSHWHTLHYNLTGTHASPEEKINFSKTHELKFMNQNYVQNIKLFWIFMLNSDIMDEIITRGGTK